ncbi:MAG TPA: hypothetical protein VF529_11340 [Solirubrobacteraceae bacterium]
MRALAPGPLVDEADRDERFVRGPEPVRRAPAGGTGLGIARHRAKVVDQRRQVRLRRLRVAA